MSVFDLGDPWIGEWYKMHVVCVLGTDEQTSDLPRGCAHGI